MYIHTQASTTPPSQQQHHGPSLCFQPRLSHQHQRLARLPSSTQPTPSRKNQPKPPTLPPCRLTYQSAPPPLGWGGRGAGRGGGPRSLVTRRRRAALAYVSAPICSIYNYVIIIITIYVVCSIYAALAYVSGPICVCMLMHVCVHIQRFLAGRRRRAAKALVLARVRLRCSVRALGA